MLLVELRVPGRAPELWRFTKPGLVSEGGLYMYGGDFGVGGNGCKTSICDAS
jgi:hypothetical protein